VEPTDDRLAAGVWLRLLSDTWAEAWKAKGTRGPYPWQMQGRDRHLLAQVAEAAGVAERMTPTAEQLAHLRRAFDRYLAACDAGTVWPAEPPNLGAFALKVAVWMQDAAPTRGPRREVHAAGPTWDENNEDPGVF
jgi:hypothetical protein